MALADSVFRKTDLTAGQNCKVPPNNMSSSVLTARQQMKRDQMMKDAAEKLKEIPEDMRTEELKSDAAGLPRYTYNLEYPTDFGREANGIKNTYVHRKFLRMNSTEEIVEFINQLVMSDDTLFCNDTYRIPSAGQIDAMFGEECREKVIYLNINVDPDDECCVPEMELSRMRINY